MDVYECYKCVIDQCFCLVFNGRSGVFEIRTEQVQWLRDRVAVGIGRLGVKRVKSKTHPS